MADRALLAAVTGLDANKTWLDTISNNIANVNTTAYNETNPEFTDLLTEEISGASAPNNGNVGGVDPVDIGAGVEVSQITRNIQEGTLTQTGQPTDVAIQGSGYFISRTNGLDSYTRDGAFQLDGNGVVTTATGGLVQGWAANNGVVNTNAPTTQLLVPTGQSVPAVATTTFITGGNLPAWNNVGPALPETSTISAYDDLGNPIPVTLTYTPVAGFPNEWNIQGTVPGAANPLWTAGTEPTVTFDNATGQVQSVAVVAGNGTSVVNADGSTSLTVQNMPSNYPDFAVGADWTIKFPAPGGAQSLTQFAGQNTAAILGQDGQYAGTLTSYSIGADGVITGAFSNGATEALGQLALATFANPEGLNSDGNQLFSVTPNSGQAQVGSPNTGTRGALVGGALESSNVDLGSQLTDLIVAQESYQANTKVVSTDQQTTQALVNMA